jgi:predicted ArsR family transcriptional regulator
MSVASLGTRFLESTRGQMVALLRRSAHTVEDLANALGLTNNAIRNHLATLERDGIVRQDGVRRSPGAGKPAIVYELHPDAEPLLSSAYVPVLRALVDVLLAELNPDQTDEVMLRLGHQLANDVGGQATGDLAARVKAAAAVLTALGGDVEVIEENGALRIRGCACPLAATVSDHPEVCRAVETLVGDVAGEPARSTCEHGPRPRCCFAIEPAS